MGREYRRRQKEIYGKGAVVGNDVIEVGGDIAPAASVATALSDANNVASFVMKRPAKLDMIAINLQSALTVGSGNVSVRALVNGAEVGSGVVLPGLARADVTFESEKDEEIELSANDILTLDVTKGATDVVRGLTARALLRLLEI